MLAGIYEVFGEEGRGSLVEVVVYGDFVLVLVLELVFCFKNVLVYFFGGGGGVEREILELDGELGGKEVFGGEDFGVGGEEDGFRGIGWELVGLGEELG